MRRVGPPGWRTTWALVPLLVVAGCALAYKAPTLTVGEVRLASMGLTGGSLAVTLEVENPNRYALESRAFRYALAFSEGSPDAPVWSTLLEGQLDRVVRFAGQAVEPVEITVPFEAASMGAALARLLRQGELEYRFSGELIAGTPLGEKRIPFDQRGLFRP
ncbi:MAG: LEA/WHy family protein [Longimicrobiales bacterium]